MGWKKGDTAILLLDLEKNNPVLKMYHCRINALFSIPVMREETDMKWRLHVSVMKEVKEESPSPRASRTRTTLSTPPSTRITVSAPSRDELLHFAWSHMTTMYTIPRKTWKNVSSIFGKKASLRKFLGKFRLSHFLAVRKNHSQLNFPQKKEK